MAGQIVPKGDRKWMVRVYIGPHPETGKKRYLNKLVHGNKKDAQAVLNELLLQKDKGTLLAPTNLTVNQFLDQWLAQALTTRVRKRTYQDYTNTLRRYVRPALGGRQLNKITPLEIQSLYNDMSGKGLSPRSVRLVHTVLHSALKQAVRWQLLTDNPSDRVDLPRQVRKEMQALSPEDARRFLDAAGKDKWAPLFLLALVTGMRPGEYLALQWGDVDLEKGIVVVQRTLSRTKDGWTFEEPKTSRSRRSIPVPQSVRAALIAHRQKQVREILARGPEYEHHDLVFATENGEPLEIRSLIRNHFKVILREAGLPVELRLYDLRHSCATLLLAEGENPKIVSERLGHASVTLTLDTYSHVLPTMQAEATKKLEDCLFG